MKKVVIVEDNRAARRLMRETVIEAGIDPDDIMEFESGEGVIQAIETLPRVPHVLIVDVFLPGIRGTELIRAIRAHARYELIPIVAVSGLKAEDIFPEVYASEASAFVEKDHLREGIPRALRSLGITRS